MPSKKIFLIFYATYLVVSCFEFVYLYNSVPTQTSVEFLKIQLICLYIFVFYSSIKIFSFKLVSIYNLFLLSFGIFILSRIFLDIFGLFDFSEISFMTQTKLTIDMQTRLLIYLIASISSIHLGTSIASLIRFSDKQRLDSDKYLEKIGIRLFAIGLPGAIAKNVMVLYFVLSQGYISLYLEKDISLTFPIWISVLSFLFLVGFVFILASLPSKKIAIIALSVFTILAFIKLFSGARGSFIISIFFIMWYYYQFYSSKNIKLTYILLFGAILIFMSVYIGFSRVDQEFNFDKISDLLTLFFSSMGGSLMVLGAMIRYEDSFVNLGLPYILNPFITLFAPASQGLERLQATPSLAEHLTYFLSPERYLGGEGVGTSFLGELFDLGLIGFLVGNFILGVFIVYFSKIATSNRLALVLSYHVITGITWMPRGGFFPSVAVMVSVVAFYFFFELLKAYSKPKWRSQK